MPQEFSHFISIFWEFFQERIQKIIDENTSSDFEGHEKKRKERTDARIKRYKEIIAKMTPQQIAEAKSEVSVAHSHRFYYFYFTFCSLEGSF